jgi:uncharacterized protein
MMRAMSTGPLPRTLDFRRAAFREASVSGSLNPGDLSRLRALLADAGGSVQASLQFRRDDEHRSVADLSVNAAVTLTCQRCLAPVVRAVSAASTLAVVATDEQARQLPRHYEPVLAADDEVDLWDLVDEELVLALPAYASHDDPRCLEDLAGGALDGGSGAAGEGGGQDRDNPFDVLAKLKAEPGGRGQTGE